MTPPPRFARLVLVTPDGALVGALPALPVATPWWQDVAPVIEAVRAAHGVEITVLRALEIAPNPKSVKVTYLAETPEPVAAAEPWDGELDEQPLRNSYAKLGGPAADLAWAKAILADQGLTPAGSPRQVRTWNLSSLWAIPVVGQTVWLKAIPPFFAHEAPLIAALAGEAVPKLLGQDGGRFLMAELPGQDLYEAEIDQLFAMVDLLVGLQAKWVGREADLFALGLPDWRAPALTAAISQVFERTAPELSTKNRGALTAFIADLPRRFADLAACGLPDTLVHGDFHPGNLRGDGARLALMDWGDSGVGHPLLDSSAFLDRVPAEALDAVRAVWLAHWREAVPGSDPAKALALLAPIAAARQAVIYRGFLDSIEPAEHPYHAADPADWLTRTALLVRAEPRVDSPR
ncbi:aminoglycoside phosphotransferase family protein [Phenylobacterium sp.]|uniref:aminoglycoside phosphotransferase family protein n=1 Tax=Phenylobacterium sp. TaxID=1871053 RepID=UPI0027268E36|nr:aminoglycoside phosphotransferase family protein [Phenylobacterium sp.]MDO8802235.1 aminoglycoside phosphotransferase family protein [Phenylobacterium sp.]